MNEFKTMVKECHRRGIEVILDVVFNHTAEGNEQGPTISFRCISVKFVLLQLFGTRALHIQRSQCRGLDNRVYYMLAPEGQYYNYSGCGNTLNCNHPHVRGFILDCLRYWVLEMHVDGFRFDLASIMTRAPSVWHRAASGTASTLHATEHVRSALRRPGPTTIPAEPGSSSKTSQGPSWLEGQHFCALTTWCAREQAFASRG